MTVLRRGVAAWVLSLILIIPAFGAGPAAESWIKPKARDSVLVGLADAGGRWIAVGERGHVLVSDDGRDWEQVRAPTRVLLTAVALDGHGLGLAVGHDATIIRTGDNGDTWDRVHHDPEEQAPLLDVIIAGDDRAIAVGAYGLYLESSDGGRTWTQNVLEPEALESASSVEDEDEEEYYYDYHLNDIAIAGDGRWYIAAEAGNVYRSDDRGGTWLRLPSPYAGSFFGVLPLDGENVLLFGLQGRLFHSSDAGAGWTRIDTGTDATLAAGLRLPNGRALVAGYAGTVLNEVGVGRDPVWTTLANRPAISDVRLLDNGDLLTVGDEGVRVWPAADLPRP